MRRRCPYDFAPARPDLRRRRLILGGQGVGQERREDPPTATELDEHGRVITRGAEIDLKLSPCILMRLGISLKNADRRRKTDETDETDPSCS